MKRSIISMLCVLFIFLFTISCKKETVKTKESIEGAWDLRKISGSWATLDYQPGSGNDINFTGTLYQIRENGQVVESGEFEIVADATAGESTCLNIEAGTYTQRIDFKNVRYPQKVFLELSGNKFTLLSGCFALDGGSRREFEKQ